MRRAARRLSENRLGEGDSPILLRGLRKIGTVPDGFRIGPEDAPGRTGFDMNIVIATDRQDLGRRAAALGAAGLRSAIADRGHANLIVATGASQFTVLAALVLTPDVDWSKVTGFHLDEYLGLPATHPASFHKYLQERFVDRVPLAAFHFIDGQTEPQKECLRIGELIGRHPIDVAMIGIGENGHLAFNDPPADFESQEPFLVVEMDEACRRQQFGEGWFSALGDVPRQAISISIRQIMKSATIICSVPDAPRQLP